MLPALAMVNVYCPAANVDDIVTFISDSVIRGFDGVGVAPSRRRQEYQAVESRFHLRSERTVDMKVRSSLKSLKQKRGSVVVRRGGRAFVINKRDPRWKARQG